MDENVVLTISGDVTFDGSADIFLDSSSDLVVSSTGDLNLQPGTTTHLDSDAEIKVNSSGKITAEGTTFQTMSGGTGSSERWKHIKLLGGGSTFTDCLFKGADNAIYNYGYNTVYSSEFADNARGDGWLSVRENGSNSSFEPARIQDANKGINITDYGNVRSNNTRYVDNNSAHVYLGGQAELVCRLGELVQLQRGLERVFPGPRRRYLQQLLHHRRGQLQLVGQPHVSLQQSILRVGHLRSFPWSAIPRWTGPNARPSMRMMTTVRRTATRPTSHRATTWIWPARTMDPPAPISAGMRPG